MDKVVTPAFSGFCIRWVVAGIFSVLCPVVAYSASTDFFLLDETQYEFWLEGSRDSTGLDDFYTELTVAPVASPGLRLAWGYSDYDDADGVINPQTYLVGVFSPTVDTFSIGFNYEHWGADGEILTDTYSVDLRWRLEKWLLSLSPSRRNIELFTRLTKKGPDRIELNGDGLLGSVICSLIPNWDIQLEAATYHYDGDPTKLNTRLAAAVFTDQALTFSHGFLEHSYSVEALRYFEWGSLGASVTRNKSAVSRLNTDIHSLKASYLLNPDVQVFLDAGVAKPQDADDSHYTTLALSVRW